MKPHINTFVRSQTNGSKYSTTMVCNELTEKAKESIEHTRHIWQPRGETVHSCLEQKMLGADDIDMGEYEEWAIHCLSWNCSHILNLWVLNI